MRTTTASPPPLEPVKPHEIVNTVIECADWRLQTAIQEFIEEVKVWEEAAPLEEEELGGLNSGNGGYGVVNSDAIIPKVS